MNAGAEETPLGYNPHPEVRVCKGTPIPPVDRPLALTPARAKTAERVWWNGPPWTILRNRNRYLQQIMEYADDEETEREREDIDEEDWREALRALKPGDMSWKSVAWWSIELELRELGSICRWPVGAHPRDLPLMRNLSREEVMARTHPAWRTGRYKLLP